MEQAKIARRLQIRFFIEFSPEKDRLWCATHRLTPQRLSTSVDPRKARGDSIRQPSATGIAKNKWLSPTRLIRQARPRTGQAFAGARQALVEKSLEVLWPYEGVGRPRCAFRQNLGTLEYERRPRVTRQVHVDITEGRLQSFYRGNELLECLWLVCCHIVTAKMESLVGLVSIVHGILD